MSMDAQNPVISGEDVRTQKVMACQDVSSIVKISLGPIGPDKMLVDDIGEVTITDDGATLLRMLETLPDENETTEDERTSLSKSETQESP